MTTPFSFNLQGNKIGLTYLSKGPGFKKLVFPFPFKNDLEMVDGCKNCCVQIASFFDSSDFDNAGLVKHITPDKTLIHFSTPTPTSDGLIRSATLCIVSSQSPSKGGSDDSPTVRVLFCGTPVIDPDQKLFVADNSWYRDLGLYSDLFVMELSQSFSKVESRPMPEPPLSTEKVAHKILCHQILMTHNNHMYERETREAISMMEHLNLMGQPFDPDISQLKTFSNHYDS